MRCTLKHLAITVVALCLGLGMGLQAGAHEGPTGADVRYGRAGGSC